MHSTIKFEPGPREFRSTLVFHLERDEWKVAHAQSSFATRVDKSLGVTANKLALPESKPAFLFQ